jgi:hypothetical protein
MFERRTRLKRGAVNVELPDAKRRQPEIAQEAPRGYSPEQVGALLKRTGRTIRKWIAQGRVKAIELGKSQGYFVIPPTEVERLRQESSVA